MVSNDRSNEITTIFVRICQGRDYEIAFWPQSSILTSPRRVAPTNFTHPILTAAFLRPSQHMKSSGRVVPLTGERQLPPVDFVACVAWAQL